jgi:hypothetical protein
MKRVELMSPFLVRAASVWPLLKPVLIKCNSLGRLTCAETLHEMKETCCNKLDNVNGKILDVEHESLDENSYTAAANDKYSAADDKPSTFSDVFSDSDQDTDAAYVSLNFAVTAILIKQLK